MYGVMRAATHLLIAMLIARTTIAGQTLLPAQTNTPQYLTVATSTSAPTVAPGAKVSLFIDVAPKPGIHVYAPGAKDYLPIAVTIKPLAGASFARTRYPKSDTIIFEKQPVPVFQKPFRLVQEATIAPTAKAGTTITLTGVVDYQACDAAICFKPAAIPVEWTFTVR